MRLVEGNSLSLKSFVVMSQRKPRLVIAAIGLNLYSLASISRFFMHYDHKASFWHNRKTRRNLNFLFRGKIKNFCQFFQKRNMIKNSPQSNPVHSQHIPFFNDGGGRDSSDLLVEVKFFKILLLFNRAISNNNE